MTGGLIQLVAYGEEDLFLTHNPQITYFKIIYRRHTNFSTEMIPQFFSHNPNFGQKVTCILSKSGDLIRKIYLVATLPRVPVFLDDNNNLDTITKFAWVRRIGYALIKTIEVQIGEQLIDKQYGEWMHIWAELTNGRDRGIDVMIGNTDYLTNFSNGKNKMKIYVPLQFWFNKVTGLALPIINLQYSEVKINLEIQDADKVYRIAPSNYIQMADDIVQFTPFEYIDQTVNNVQAAGIFTNYDVINKRLYYYKLTRNKFLGTPNSGLQFEDAENQEYLIKGHESKFEGMPFTGATERTHRFNSFRSFSLRDTFLLTEYIYLDEEERVKFSQDKHEYLIEQIQYSGEKQLNSVHNKIRIGFNHPTKLILWVAQMDYLTDVNDSFNFTNSWKYVDGKTVGTNLIEEGTLILNGREMISFRSSDFFSLIHPYQFFPYQSSTGVNIYSFSLHPNKHQPSGTLNMSKIDNILLQINIDSQIEFKNTANLRCYTVVYNLLRISNGLGGMVFTDS